MGTTKMLAGRDGYDSPVSRQDYDDYRRWPVASAISSIIATTPVEWSTRIGLYGRWGDGKTTVLNFLELQQRKAGNIVVRYSPWGALDDDSLWKSFARTLKAALKDAGIEFDASESTKQAAKTVGRWARMFGGSAAEVADKFLPVNVATTLAKPALSFLERYVGFSPDDVDAMLTNIAERRVVVFIDDLDRADPSVIPRMLLTLRELLDLPHFVFVLAFDRGVVSPALAAHNPGWGRTGDAFLEKIVDFPFELPEPAQEQVLALATRFFASTSDFLPMSTLESIKGLLPPNPRRLKLFARLIASLSTEARRHDSAELDWPTILIFHLLRLESEDFARKVIGEVMTAEAFSWLVWAGGGQRAEQEEARLEQFIANSFEEGDPRVSRVRQLMAGWRERRVFQAGERLKYQVTFSMRPHNMTWGEFKTAFVSWRRTHEKAVFDQFVVAQARALESTTAQVAAELLETALGHYGALLESASESRSAEQHRATIDEAGYLLSAVEALVDVGVGGVAPEHLPLTITWLRLYGLSRQWIHFSANEGEPELRGRELALLLRWASASDEKVKLFETLQPWGPDGATFDDRTTRLRNEMRQQLGDVLWPAVVDAAFELFETPDGIESVVPSGARELMNFALAAPGSRLYAPQYRDRLEALLARASDDAVMHRNAHAYLELMVAALSGYGRYCTPDQRRHQIQNEHMMFEDIWAAATARPLQFRMLQSLRELRERLVAVGVEENRIPLPDWAQDRAV